MTFPWQELGDRIYRRRYPSLDLNVGVVVTDEGVVVIDTRADHAQADQLLEELRILTNRMVRWVINTHFHWDHTFGNARFAAATIVGHTRCRARMTDEGEAVRRRLTESPWPWEGEEPDFAGVDIVPPDVTFDRSLALHPGGREIRLSYLGRGHTDSDIVIWVDGVCFAGDLVEHGAPPSFDDAYPREWLDTLDVLAPLAEDMVVPGHGDLVDTLFVRAQRADIAAAIRVIDEGEDPARGPYPTPVMEKIAERLAPEV